MQRVQFRRAGTAPDGSTLYDLWIDSEPVRSGLEIDEVLRIIGDRDEADLPRRVPAAFRTPEDGAGFETRKWPK